MRKLMRVAALVLCMMFVFLSALAQEAAYKIGQPSNEAFLNAFASGKLVTAKINLDLDMNGEALGMTAEEAQEMDAVLAALKQAELTAGAGLTDQGVRVALEAVLTDAQGGNPVSVDALADVTLDGVAVESSVIPGKRLTAKWETILALCGVPQEDIDMIMSLKAIDPDEVLELLEEAIEEAMADIEPMIEMAAQLAMPYAETVIKFVQTLPIEVRENLSEEGYPPTATEIGITITGKDIGTLLSELCAQLDADASLKIMINALLAQADMGVTIDEVIDEIQSSAAEMTGTDMPVTFFLGMNEDDIPMYVEVYILDEPTQENIYGGFFLYRDAQNMWNLEVVGGMYDAEGNPYGTGYLGGTYLGDPADPNVYAAKCEIYVAQGETPLMEMAYTIENVRAEDDPLGAYDMELAMSAYIEDGSGGIRMAASQTGRQGKTENGGEKVAAVYTMDTYAGEYLAAAQTQEMEQLVEPTADGGVTGYTKATQSMTASGIDKLELNVVYASEDIDMAASQALEQIALETATEDEMNALLMQATNVLSGEKLPAVMTNLPAELVQMIQSGM